MQTTKWKFITAGLVLVILILCMMTFYLNSSNRNLLIQLNRMDREKGEYQRDYEKLYNAYYSYDQKILKILESNQNVFWAKDSSGYVVKGKNEFLFSFYKKPRMNSEFFLYQFGSVDRYWGDPLRIDSLKPHQFASVQWLFQSPEDGSFQKFKGLFVARPVNIKENNYSPDTSSIVVKIYYQ
jgi:hypothetical protein